MTSDDVRTFWLAALTPTPSPVLLCRHGINELSN